MRFRLRWHGSGLLIARIELLEEVAVAQHLLGSPGAMDAARYCSAALSYWPRLSYATAMLLRSLGFCGSTASARPHRKRASCQFPWRAISVPKRICLAASAFGVAAARTGVAETATEVIRPAHPRTSDRRANKRTLLFPSIASIQAASAARLDSSHGADRLAQALPEIPPRGSRW
jgi:hypothetical protein